ncbi:MAG TPA: flagellar biosynthesis protein FlhB [Solirubrobacteraceae bacterium]
MAGGEKTEAPTPKRLEEARKKGQVAKSNDLNGAVVLLAGLLALGAAGPAMVGHIRDVMTTSLAQIAEPGVVSPGGLGTLMQRTGRDLLAALAPVCLACAAAAIAVNVGQVGFRPTLGALKPDFKKLNPASGFKQIYGTQALAELAKNLIKVGAVAAIIAAALLPQLGQLGAMVGVGAQELSGQLAHTISSLARRAAVAYLLIGLADFAYQKRRHIKSLRMDKQEVKEEAKQQQLPPEVRGALRRRQMAAARARMMAAVPTADVVVTNPTHFSVALKYDGSAPAPEVVAKGQDLVALKIRELASDHGVPVVPDPPLARSLHASVEVGQQVPEELYEAVAQLLAFVYRVAAARREHHS